MLDPASLPEGIEGRAWQRGCQDEHVRRKIAGEKGQPPVRLMALHLVQTVQHQDKRPFPHGLRQPLGESFTHLVRLAGDLLRYPVAPLDLAQESAKEARDRRTVRGGAEVVDKDEGLGVAFSPLRDPGSQQGGLAPPLSPVTTSPWPLDSRALKPFRAAM